MSGALMRIGFFEAKPHQVHKAFREAAGAEPICGLGMAWAKGRSGLLGQLYYRGMSPILKPVDGLRFRGRFDVIITPSYGLHLAAWIKRFDRSLKLIYFNYCPFLDWVSKAPSLQKAYHRRALSAVDGVISGSALNAERASALLQVPQVVCHPFGGEAFRDISPPDSSRTLLVVGPLHPIKRVDRALEVLRALKGQGADDWRLVLVGDGRGKEMYEKEVAALDGVEFTGQVSSDRLASLYGQAFALLQLSDFDNFPVAVLEASSAGVLPLVSDNVGSVEILPDMLVVKNGDPKDAAECLLSLARMTSAERGVLRGRCRQAAELFSRERQTELFREAVEALVS